MITIWWASWASRSRAARREERLAEELGPLGERAVRGDDHRGLLVPPGDDLVDIVGGWGAQRLQAEVIEEELRSGEAREAVLVRAVRAARGQLRERAGRLS